MIDPARRKSVHGGPEEFVRQRIIRFMIETMAVPAGLMAVEKELGNTDTVYRADVVVYSRDGKPWMVIECKSPSVRISQDAFDQIGKYNRILKAPYLLVTNGKDHYCCEWMQADGTVRFLEQLPMFPDRPSR